MTELPTNDQPLLNLQGNAASKTTLELSALYRFEHCSLFLRFKEGHLYRGDYFGIGFDTKISRNFS